MGETSLKMVITHVLDIRENSADEKKSILNKKNFVDFFVQMGPPPGPRLDPYLGSQDEIQKSPRCPLINPKEGSPCKIWAKSTQWFGL